MTKIFLWSIFYVIIFLYFFSFFVKEEVWKWFWHLSWKRESMFILYFIDLLLLWDIIETCWLLLCTNALKSWQQRRYKIVFSKLICIMKQRGDYLFFSRNRERYSSNQVILDKMVDGFVDKFSETFSRRKHYTWMLILIQGI